MQCRLLTIEELETLKDEFVKFLILQGIDAVEWQRIKGDEPLKALKVIEVFSDFIFTNVINKLSYIQYFDNNSLKLFKCLDDKICLINITSEESYHNLDHMITTLNKNPNKFDIQRMEKCYVPDRSTEIFRMIKNGGALSDGLLFEYFQG